MKKRFLGILLGTMIISMCVGCGTENTPTEPSETATTTAESTPESTATPEETAKPTPEATTEQSEEAETEPTETEEATAEPTETAETESTEEPTPEPTEEPEPEYTYTDMSATMYATQTVNVRSLPSTDGEKVGSLSTNQEVVITGQANTGWYRIEYNGETAYVSNNYLSNEIVEVAQAESGQTEQTASTSYEAYTWYDMNDFMFIIVNTKDEGATAPEYGGLDYSGVQATLQERYPDNQIYIRNGRQMKDGRWCFLAYSDPASSNLRNFLDSLK